MRRLGAVLLVILLVSGMNVRSVWSGGGKWGSGTPSGARTDAYWLPDGQTPTGRPFPDVAIGGTLVTDSVMSASWNLGPSDITADLAPATATLTLKGQVSASIGDDVVISSALSGLWSGRVDTISDTLDAAGDHWTTVTATDKVGALGAAQLQKSAGVRGTVEAIAESLAADAGVALDVVNVSSGTYGLATLRKMTDFGASYTFDGSVLEYINLAARSSNALVASQPNGSLAVTTREALGSAPSPTALTGSNAPREWTKMTSADVDINRWVLTQPDGTIVASEDDRADVNTYGERAFRVDNFLDQDTGSGVALAFLDWWAFGGSQRPVAAGVFAVADYAQDELLMLAPLDWVTVNGEDWQVLSMSWSATPGQPWTLTITADNLLDLL